MAEFRGIFGLAGRRRDAEREQRIQDELNFQRRLAEQQEIQQQAQERKQAGNTARGTAALGRASGVDPGVLQNFGAGYNLYEQAMGNIPSNTTVNAMIANPDVRVQAGLQNLRDQAQTARNLAQEGQRLSNQAQQLNIRNARQNLEIGAARLEQVRAGVVPLDQQLNVVNQFRDDWLITSADDREVVLSADQAIAAINNPTSVGAFAAITKLAKVLDPGSVVRTEEARGVQESMGLGDYLKNQWNKLGGEGMNESSKAAFIQLIKSVSAPSAGRLIQVADGYKAAAGRYNLNVQDIFLGTYNEELVRRYAGPVYGN
jgi:hypothetical protein